MNQTGSGSIAPAGSNPDALGGEASHATSADRLREGMKAGLEDVKGAAREGATAVMQGLTSAANDARDQANALAGEAKNRAYGIAEQQKKVGAEQIGSVARAVHGAADSLQQGAPTIARFVHEAASGIDRVSDDLNRKSVDEILHSVEHFARTQPAVFFGATAVVGFALARFLKSSAEKRQEAAQAAAGPVRKPRPRAPIDNRQPPRSSGAQSTGMASERMAGAPGAYTAAQSSSNKPSVGGTVGGQPRKDHSAGSATSRGEASTGPDLKL